MADELSSCVVVRLALDEDEEVAEFQTIAPVLSLTCSWPLLVSCGPGTRACRQGAAKMEQQSYTRCAARGMQAR